MNVAQLQAWAGQNKVALLGAGAAGAVLLGLRTRSKATSGGAKQPAGTLPAAAVVPANGLQATGSTYDSSAYDVYNALQSELGPFLQAQQNQTGTRSGVTDVPPISKTLFAPNMTGQYVYYKNGAYGEIESDGSVYGISQAEATPDQWSKIFASATGIGQTPTIYSDRASNLASKVPAPTTPATS